MTKVKQLRDTSLVMDGSVIGFFPREFFMFDNFSSFQVEWRGKLWPTSEHAYHAAKFFETDPELAEKIHSSRSAQDALTIARANKDKYAENWQDIMLEIMEEIVRAKCDQHPYVKQKLLETMDETLVEDSPYDSIWGWGPDRKGRNELGKIWMKIREDLKKGEK